MRSFLFNCAADNDSVTVGRYFISLFRVRNSKSDGAWNFGVLPDRTEKFLKVCCETAVCSGDAGWGNAVKKPFCRGGSRNKFFWYMIAYCKWINTAILDSVCEGTYKAALSTDLNAADTRKTKATSLIKPALALEGIADTPEVDKLIDVVIPLLVLALPKTHTEVSA